MHTYYVIDRLDAIPYIDGKVTSVFFDIENQNKNKRQPSNHIISNSCIGDIPEARSATKRSELMVRINPINDNTDSEVAAVKLSGVDIVMLPYFKYIDEVQRLFNICGEKLPICLLVETPEALINLRKILWNFPVKRVHFGLNDLKLALGRDNTFEVVFDNSLQNAIDACCEFSIPFGVGGIGKVGLINPTPEEMLLRCTAMGAEWIILNRSFADYRHQSNLDAFSNEFSEELKKMRHLFKSIEALDSAAINRDSKQLGVGYTSTWYA